MTAAAAAAAPIMVHSPHPSAVARTAAAPAADSPADLALTIDSPGATATTYGARQAAESPGAAVTPQGGDAGDEVEYARRNMLEADYGPPGGGGAAGQYGAFANLDAKYSPRASGLGTPTDQTRLAGGGRKGQYARGGLPPGSPVPAQTRGLPTRQKIKIALLQFILLSVIIGTSTISFYHFTHMREYAPLEQAAMSSRQILATQENMFRRLPPGGWKEEGGSSFASGAVLWGSGSIRSSQTRPPNVSYVPVAPPATLSHTKKMGWETLGEGRGRERPPVELREDGKHTVFASEPWEGGHHGGRGPRVDALGLFTRKQPARIGGQPLAAMVAGGGDPAGLPKLHAAQVAAAQEDLSSVPENLAEDKVMTLEKLEKTAHLDTHELNADQFGTWLDGAASEDHFRDATSSIQNAE